MMKLSTSIRYTRKAAKNLKMKTNNLKIKAKKEDYTIIDIKEFILLLQSFCMYTQIIIFLAAPNSKL